MKNIKRELVHKNKDKLQKIEVVRNISIVCYFISSKTWDEVPKNILRKRIVKLE